MPGEGGADEGYRASTEWEKLVADYCGVGLPEVGGMPYTYYLRMRRDAYIHALRQTEGGREYLENAYRLTRTGFDAGAMRRTFGTSARA